MYTIPKIRICDQTLINKCDVQLRADVVPRTAENFRALCTGMFKHVSMLTIAPISSAKYRLLTLPTVIEVSAFNQLRHREYAMRDSILPVQVRRAWDAPENPCLSREAHSTV